MMKRQLLCLFFIFSFLSSEAQDKTIDSLKLALKNAKHDTTRCHVLNLIIDATYPKEEWKAYNDEIISIAERNYNNPPSNKILVKTFAKYYADGLNNAGYIFKTKSEIPKALEYYNKSLEIRIRINDKGGQAESYNNMGVIFDYQGNVDKTLEYYNKSLKLREELDDKKGIAVTRNNIGLLYGIQGDVTKALEYFNKNLKMQTEIHDQAGIALSYNNIGYISDMQKDYIKALKNYKISLKIYQDIGDKNCVARELSNIGVLYYKQSNYTSALEYYLQSLEISKETQNLQQTGNTLHNIGTIYYKQKNLKQALYFGTKAMEIGKKLGFPYNIKPAANLLSQTYKALEKHKLALENYELYIQMRDSINNEENRKASFKSQFKYEYEKKAAADSVKVAEEKKVVAVQLKQEKTQRFALYGGLALAGLFGAFMFNRFKVTQKQKHIIIEQKHIVEEKHKEITDSINYAERIQRSFMATHEHLSENLKDYFVFFKPKDVVSGDFYWTAKLNNNHFALVCGDSTGHGVPGAIMSLLNITSLEKSVETETAPHKILDTTRKIIIDRLKKDGSDEGGKDGMDCSLCVFDFTNNKLFIATAHNPVWIVRSVITPRRESEVKNHIIEIKPDKMPVGKHDKDQTPFSQHQIELQKGDVIYALTDGFPDQFGGPKGKKFMSKNLRELLATNAHLPMHEQKQLIETNFVKWKGDLEQVDDVTVIGVRI